MKKWILLLSVLCITACGNKGGDNNNSGPAPTTPPNTATTPLDSSCLQGGAYCDNTVYNQSGWRAYPDSNYQNYQGYYNFCACPAGYIPAYNGSIGLGCVRTRYVPRTYFQWQFEWQSRGSGRRYHSTRSTINSNYSYAYSNGNGADLGQQSNTRPPSFKSRNCFQNVAQSCFVDQPNNCYTGGICQATGAGNLGICTSRVTSGSGGR